MAINFNKLFLQNLLPKAHSAAEHAQGVGGYDAEEDGEDERRLDENDEALSGQSDRNADKLARTLESLRKIIDNHRGKSRPDKLNHDEHLPLIAISPLTVKDAEEPSSEKSYQKASTTYSRPHTNQHRRNPTGHQPYQVDAAPASLGLSEPQSFKTNERMSKKSEKVIVEVRVVFLKIGEIDTLKEMYRADAFIQVKWFEPRLNGKTEEELSKIDLTKCWNPLVYIENILTESKDQHWMYAKVDNHGVAVITERRRLRGIFLETLELNDFPLDVQDLTITLSSERPDTEVDLVPDHTDLCGINLQTFVDQQEWRLHEHIEIKTQSVVQEYTSSSQQHPCVSVTCRAARRPGYFYWNVFLIMFFITGLSFATFAVSAERPESRLQLSFTLFLTSVAFKFVINQSLPKISYLTFMDKYVLMSLGILCIVSVWHAIVTLVPVYSLPDPSIPNSSTTGSHDVYSNDWTSFPFLQGPFADAQNSNNLLDFFGHNQLSFINLAKSSGSRPQILLPRYVIPSWMNESFNEALKFASKYSEMSKPERDMMILQKAIDITLKRRLQERRRKLDLRRTELRKLQIERTRLLNRVERDVFVIFCVFYIVCHLGFIFWLYFGVSKRRREMIERDKQYRLCMRKQRGSVSTIEKKLPTKTIANISYVS